MSSEVELQKRKIELEIAKLEKELNAPQNVWWVRPVYLSIIAPLIVGGLTFVWSWWVGVYDAERRIAAAEAVIAETEVAKIRNELETLEALQRLQVRHQQRVRELNEELCGVRTALEGYGVPWRFPSWSMEMFDIAAAELNGRYDLMLALVGRIEELEANNSEAAELKVLLGERLQSIAEDGAAFAAEIKRGREDFGAQIDAFQSVYQALGTSC